jgi:hypothetical protein
MCAAVCDDGIRLTHAFQAVPDIRLDGDERVVVRTEKDFLDGAGGRRPRAVVVEHELDTAEYARVVERHLTVLVPTLDDIGKDRGEVDLAELDEMRVVATQHVEDRPALVRNSAKRQDANAFDRGLARHARTSFRP